MFDQLVKRSDAVSVYTTGRFAEERHAHLCAFGSAAKPDALRMMLGESCNDGPAVILLDFAKAFQRI